MTPLLTRLVVNMNQRCFKLKFNQLLLRNAFTA